ncbi:MAG: hypothetical protein WA463_10675 [Terriglobales bacterium]
MNCVDFQKVLPYIIETGGNPEEEAHLKSCAVCSGLVQDLRYIAEAAKLLLPMQEPGPRVWNGIQGALEREGLVRPLAGTVRFRPQIEAIPSHRHWVSGGSLLAFAALLLFAIGILWYYNRASQPAVSASLSQPASPAVDDDDAQMLSAVQKKSPALAATYRENLDAVNAYIRDAQQTVKQDPRDMGARDHLIRAYDQKTLLYEMALARSQQ